MEIPAFSVSKLNLPHMKAAWFLTLITSVALFNGSCVPEMDAATPKEHNENIKTNSLNYRRLKARATQAEAWCRSNNMNTGICLLADMSIHSGRERMVVWDFAKDTVAASGLVSHGCSSNPWGKDHSKDKPVFSNQFDSHCSSLGKYKIGERGYSQWGIHVKYLMHGLEATNKNALAREVVLHGWDAIADQEVYPDGTPEGWGCPAVSNKFMTTLDRFLKDRRKPVLLWVYQ